jgi:glyoxylase-like metal-dependent hydrolase (beta-lactamase superfamily II)
MAHPLAIPFLADPRSLRLHPYRHLFWGTPKPSTALPVGELVTTPRHTFQVIGAPGHSADSICLYEPDEGWLFAGDAYVGGLDRALRVGFDICKIIASLRAMSALPLSRIFPGSGSVVEDPGPALSRKIAYLEETGAKIRALSARGRSVTQIRQEMFGPEMFINLVTLGDFSGANLVRSYLQPADAGSGEVGQRPERAM